MFLPTGQSLKLMKVKVRVIQTLSLCECIMCMRSFPHIQWKQMSSQIAFKTGRTIKTWKHGETNQKLELKSYYRRTHMNQKKACFTRLVCHVWLSQSDDEEGWLIYILPLIITAPHDHHQHTAQPAHGEKERETQTELESQ